MGTYLAIKLSTKVTLHKSEVETKGRTSKKFLKQINKYKPKMTELFDFGIDTENQEVYTFTLKPTAFQTDLIPLLTAFYGDFYGENRHLDVLEKIKSCTTFEELMNYAEDSYTPFQKHWDFERMTLKTSKRKEIPAYGEGVLLSVEGKISFESIDYSLSFFEKMMWRGYSRFGLGAFLQVGFV